MLRARPGLERYNAVDRDGAASLTAFRMGAVGGDNLDIDFAALVVEIENVRGQTLTIVKREDADCVEVDIVQPLREFCIRHLRIILEFESSGPLLDGVGRKLLQ